MHNDPRVTVNIVMKKWPLVAILIYNKKHVPLLIHAIS